MRKNYPHLFKRAALILLAAGATHAASAQFRYTVKDTTTPYAPITSGISLNGGTVWDDDIFTANIPFAWKLDSVYTMTDVPVDLSLFGIVSDPNSTTKASGFFGAFSDFVDRGDGTGSSLSPITYSTTGTAPNRIFKLQFENAGFFDDPNLTDFINMQMWIYETSNVVEYHFGSSSFTPGADYFYNGGSPVMGVAHDVEINNGTSGTLYYLKSVSSGITVDTLNLPFMMPPSNGLSAWPSSGTVFRFTPKLKQQVRAAVPVAATLTNVKVYPTVADQQLTVEGLTAGSSVVVLSSTGQQAAQFTISNAKEQLNISSLAAGSYMLRMVDKSGAQGTASFSKK